MQGKRRAILCAPLIAAMLAAVLNAAGLEEAYNDYLQGRYEDARFKLLSVMDAKPTPEEAYKLQQELGLRAFLEMDQNQYLADAMRKIGGSAWQFERKDFKQRRRIEYYLKAYLEDQSLRPKALMNLMGAGEYAVPLLLDNLGSRQKDVAKRTLAYQALSKMGREAVPGMVVATYSEDPILLSNLIRLFAEARDLRALPYMARLKEGCRDSSVQSELSKALQKFPDISATNASILMIAEANRYIREDQGAIMESLISDGIIWEWNPKNEAAAEGGETAPALESLNLLGIEFEFRPTLPTNLWSLFRAEMILYEMSEHGLAAPESAYLRASLICVWAAQDSRVAELLKDPKLSKVEHIQTQLDDFLRKRRELEVEVSHWAGTETMLVALDMANKLFSPFVAARVLKNITDYHPQGLLETQVVSFVDGRPTNPVLDSLHHSNEMVRYWAAIAAGRANTALANEAQPLVMDLLAQAVDEVQINSVLLVAPLNGKTDTLKKELGKLGYNVYHVETGFDGLNSLREFPSKDFVILDAGLEDRKTLSSQEFASRMRQDYKGGGVPLAMFSPEDRKAEVMGVYQDLAQESIVEGESGEILKAKMENLKKHMKKMVFSKDIVLEVCTASLATLKGLDNAVIRSYPVLVNHLSDAVAHNFHTRDQQVGSVQVLEKFGDLAFSVTPVLLDRLWNDNTDHEYKLSILSAMRQTARNHPQVRSALYEMVANHQVDRRLRIQAASYLGLDTALAKEEEKRKFQKPFFTRSYREERSGM